ncbi:MAG: hypothetical protein JSS79_05320 [Bacteroidetes bacterium]|nr:hypothetical protein [Bacteroidota bacterium]
MFVKRSDFQTVITADQLEQLVPDALDSVLNQQIDAATIEVQAYLRSVYDMSLVMPPIYDWSPYVIYNANDAVWYNNLIYVLLPSGTAGSGYASVNSGTNGILSPDVDINWQQNDFRDQKLVQIMIDIVLFFIHKRVSPRQVPQHRLTAYDMAIHYLDELRKGNLSSNMPTVPQPVDHPNVWSIQPRQQWRF